jgi:hypothetical protein
VWIRLVAWVTGSANQELLPPYGDLAMENRILEVDAFEETAVE